MVLSDWSQCTKCHFPALYSQFKLYLSKFSECPMCNLNVKLDELDHFDELKAKECLRKKAETVEKHEDQSSDAQGKLKRSTHAEEFSQGVGGLVA
jgi:WD repeat-containing protein 19